MDRFRSDGADGENGRPPSGGQRFLSYADLEERYGKSRVTIWRWVRAGLLPAPYWLGLTRSALALRKFENATPG